MQPRVIKMSPHAPTPDDAENVKFFIQWWQQILGGTIITLTAWFLKSKGKSAEPVIIPIGEKEFTNRMTICKQSVLMAIKEDLNERDKALFAHIEKRDEALLEHIKELIKK